VKEAIVSEMSEMQVTSSAPIIREIHEVRATFATPDLMQNAITQLEMSGFDRADLSLPEVNPPEEFATPEAGARPADTEEDARQARTLQTSAAAAIAAMAAGGAVIATGGAVAPAIAAAGTLVLSVRTPNEAKRGDAEVILRSAGATSVQAR
jgi:hypothetical protein